MRCLAIGYAQQDAVVGHLRLSVSSELDSTYQHEDVGCVVASLPAHGACLRQLQGHNHDHPVHDDAMIDDLMRITCMCM